MPGSRIYDVSLTIHPDMPVWPGDPGVKIKPVDSISGGDSGNVSVIHLSTHAGTHVDAPRHFIPRGIGIDGISPEVLVGRARLVRISSAIQSVDRKTLEKLDLKNVERLILSTRDSSLAKEKTITPDYAFLSEDAAQYLVDKGIKLVGTDNFSIDEFHNNNQPAHHILLAAGVVILEGLDLIGIPAADYELLCLPLKIENADGAPARVFLKELNE